jgi:hypothetical protein
MILLIKNKINMQTPKLPPVHILRDDVHSKLSKGFPIEIEKKLAHLK